MGNDAYPSVRTSGFTLIEVVIAVLVLTIGMSGVIGLTFWMVQSNAWSGAMTTASTLGEDKLEELRATPYADLADGNDSVAPFRRIWTVSGASNDFKCIEVEVEWTRHNDGVSRVNLSTLVSNPDVQGVNLGSLNIDVLSSGGGGT